MSLRSLCSTSAFTSLPFSCTRLFIGIFPSSSLILTSSLPEAMLRVGKSSAHWSFRRIVTWIVCFQHADCSFDS